MAKPIVVGVSGGVDSAVAAALLKQQGHDVVAVFMKNWEEEGDDGVCTAQEDYDMVRGVCQKLDIPYYTANFTREYRDRVFADFLHELEAGRTPNPDVLCNREIKFKAFLDMALQLDAQNLATGHYAQLGYDEKGHRTLLRGVDPGKDQSYFLYMLGQPALERAMFPVGGMLKRDVRAVAEKLGLPNAARKDSTGICFIGERNFSRFLSQHLASKSGNIVDTSGRVLGRHDGLIFYTIGQRKGIRLGGGSGDGRPWFVAEKRLETNELVVVEGHDAPQLYAAALIGEQTHFIAGEAPAEEFDCTCKIRYRQPDQKAHVKLLDDGVCRVDFEVPQRAVTPGQSVVFYRGDVCLGGAIITRAER